METWILEALRRKYVRQLVAWGAAAAVVVFFYALNARYLENFARGPYPVGTAALDSIGDVTTVPRYFVRVTPDKTMETGLREIAVETQNGQEVSRHVSAEYYAVALGDKLLIVKSATAPGATADGELTLMPEELESNLFDTKEKQAQRGRIYPFYLDAASGFRTGGYWAAAFAVAFLALLVWRWRIAWGRLHDIEADPVAVRVASWGDRVTTAATIERELQGVERRKWGAWSITPNYLVQRSFFGFNVLRFHDLLWGYKKVTQRRVNFIPVGKYYSALLHFYGGNAVLQGSEKKVDELLLDIPRRAPWAVLGYSKELQQLWAKQNAKFCAEVEQRRRAT